jgi:hypothetical protein
MSEGSQLNILSQRLKGRLELSEQAREWTALIQHLEKFLGKKPDMNALLFLQPGASSVRAEARHDAPRACLANACMAAILCCSTGRRNHAP